MYQHQLIWTQEGLIQCCSDIRILHPESGHLATQQDIRIRPKIANSGRMSEVNTEGVFSCYETPYDRPAARGFKHICTLLLETYLYRRKFLIFSGSGVFLMLQNRQLYEYTVKILSKLQQYRLFGLKAQQLITLINYPNPIRYPQDINLPLSGIWYPANFTIRPTLIPTCKAIAIHPYNSRQLWLL